MGKVLVTGGTGFIGSHTSVLLLEQGYDVVIFDNFSNSSPEVADKICEITGKKPILIEGDLLDIKAVEQVFSTYDITAVIHFAGYKAVGESNEKPLEYYHNNITGTLHLLQMMQKYNCYNLIFSSSATVYGLSTDVPFHEDSPTSAINPYGRTKLFIESIITDFCKANSQMKAVLLRYFNPVGAHKTSIIGENPKGIPNNLVPYVAKVAMGELTQLSIFGDDYDTEDGTGVRDYIHVLDLAQGHILALEYALPKEGFVEAINLGSGKGTSVYELVKTYEKASGRPIQYQVTPRREGDIGICYADTKKAKKLLGFETKQSVYDMCLDSWNYVSKG